jgi:hypothetical protein
LAEVVQCAIQQCIRQPVKVLYPERLTQHPERVTQRFRKYGSKLTGADESQRESRRKSPREVRVESIVNVAGEIQGNVNGAGNAQGVGDAEGAGAAEMGVKEEVEGAGEVEGDADGASASAGEIAVKAIGKGGFKGMGEGPVKVEGPVEDPVEVAGEIHGPVDIGFAGESVVEEAIEIEGAGQSAIEAIAESSRASHPPTRDRRSARREVFSNFESASQQESHGNGRYERTLANG